MLPSWLMSTGFYSSTEQRRVRNVLRDLVRSRELLLDLIWKDLRVRYRYALMGFVWAVVEPVALMFILTFIFTRIFPRDDPRFAAKLLCGLVFWQFLATSLSEGTRSLVDNRNLVDKVHFPREIIPLATVGNCLVNLAIGFVILLIVHLALRGALGFALVYFPVLFAIQFLLVSGLTMLLSCLHVYYRDVGYIVNVAMIFGFYATPIFYELEMVRARINPAGWLYRLYVLNPMVELVTAYRQVLFENRFPDAALLWWPCAAAAVCLIGGVSIFRRQSPLFADQL